MDFFKNFLARPALKADNSYSLGLVKKLGFVLAPARTRLAGKQNAGLLVGSPSFADTASRSRSQPKMEDNLFTSPYISTIEGVGVIQSRGGFFRMRPARRWRCDGVFLYVFVSCSRSG